MGRLMPAFHWAQASAIRSMSDMMVVVLQCFRKSESWPSPCRTFHGIIPHPANDFGQKRIGFAVFRLKPCLAKMSGRDFASARSKTCGEKKHCGSTNFKLAQYTAWYARSAPCRESAPVPIRREMSLALFFKTSSCWLCFASTGDFQCPRVLWGSSDCLAGISIISPVSASLTCSCRSSQVFLGRGIPLGKKSNLKTWYEHFGNSNLPPEHQSKSFHAWQSCCACGSISQRVGSDWG